MSDRVAGPVDEGLYVGLISGTSVDAVDAAAVGFGAPGEIRIAATRAHPMPEALRRELLALGQGGSVDLDRLGELDTAVGRLFADAATALLRENGIDPGRVRAIGSHGQTLRHRPAAHLPFTLQIGDPSTIAERTGITTVADFRRRDLAAGGEGAPLVPAFHAALLRTRGRGRVVLNLGGIANITVLPGDPAAPVTGFDTGPANGLMDAWISRSRGDDFDRDGRWAATGRVAGELLVRLLGDPYFTAAPPKSTGREVFNLEWLERHLQGTQADLAPEDIQATLLALTVESVARAVRDHAAGTEELLVCGGGARNPALLAALAAALPDLAVGTTETHGLAPEWVEAAAFAWLARETLAGRPGNLPAVTGAGHPVVLGGIYPGARWPQSRPG